MGFQQKLAKKGWLAMAWPEEYGGGGASHMQQLVYNEEMSYAGAPHTSMGIWWVGPSLMLYGSDEQKNHYIPKIANADDWWCTLYSEPGAGSDLAAMQTRAQSQTHGSDARCSQIVGGKAHLAQGSRPTPYAVYEMSYSSHAPCAHG